MSLALMDDINVNGGSYGSSPDQAKQSLPVRHFVRIEADDHVVRLYPRLGSRILGDYRLNEETWRLGRGLRLYTQPSRGRLIRWHDL
jgi:hypothetical protein